MRRFSLRLVPALAVLAAVAAAAAAGAFAAKSAPLRLSAPARVFQGKVAVVTATSSSFSCKLTVRYANGETQANIFPTSSAKGKVVWQWKVGDFAAAGQAKLTVACPGSAKATKSVIVVGGLIPPKILVMKRGFSSRVKGSNENVSYGIVLQNTSPNGNALNVGVLVNLVMPDNHLIGTASATIPEIDAGSTFNFGGEVGFIGAPTIARLEVVVSPGGRAKFAKTLMPSLDNTHLVPSPFEPQWLGSIEGDLINVAPKLTLGNANLSCVVFDASGNVLGGGTGSLFVKLLPGTRSFFKISSGLDAIPFNAAATVAVSILPSYETGASP